MKTTKVAGKNQGDIMLYAISTCGWCAKTKQFLNHSGLEYEYVDVDLLLDDDRQQAIEQVRKWNPSISFPTMVINNSGAVVGYNEEAVKEALGL